MAHRWHRGAFAEKASWHRQEKIIPMLTADDMIAAAKSTGAWPVELEVEAVLTQSGLPIPDKRAIIGRYEDNSRLAIGCVGNDFRPTSPEERDLLVQAAFAAGAKADGAFALRGGSRWVATFVIGSVNGIKNKLVLTDAYDGTMRLCLGLTSIRVVCDNTVAMYLSVDGVDAAKLRHSSSLGEKIKLMAESIELAIAQGQTIKAAYEAAEQKELDAKRVQEAFDALFPPAEVDASKIAMTKADNIRTAALEAMKRPENRVMYRGSDNNVATLWNAATFLVDRNPDGTPKRVHGDGDPMDAMYFGSRGKRIQEIQTIIEVIMRDGKLKHMTATQALEAGVQPDQVGRAVLADMLAE